MKQLLLLVVLVPVEPLLVELDHHLPIVNSPFQISVSGPDSMKSVDPYPDPYSESGTCINEQKDQRTKCIQYGKVLLQSIPAVLRIRDV